MARDLKAGLYTARALSFVGVDYDAFGHALTERQIEHYDTCATAFKVIHQISMLRLRPPASMIQRPTVKLQSRRPCPPLNHQTAVLQLHATEPTSYHRGH